MGCVIENSDLKGRSDFSLLPFAISFLDILIDLKNDIDYFCLLR